MILPIERGRLWKYFSELAGADNPLAGVRRVRPRTWLIEHDRDARRCRPCDRGLLCLVASSRDGRHAISATAAGVHPNRQRHLSRAAISFSTSVSPIVASVRRPSSRASRPRIAGAFVASDQSSQQVPQTRRPADALIGDCAERGRGTAAAARRVPLSVRHTGVLRLCERAREGAWGVAA